jgi:hypothetical protein
VRSGPFRSSSSSRARASASTFPRGVPDVEQPADQRLDPPSVHRWSLANPCASEPFRSSSSSRAHCCGLSFSRDTGPLDLSASVPPGRLPAPHRPQRDPQVPGDLTDPIAPRNRPAASSRRRSRRRCSTGVYPPRCLKPSWCPKSKANPMPYEPGGAENRTYCYMITGGRPDRRTPPRDCRKRRCKVGVFDNRVRTVCFAVRRCDRASPPIAQKPSAASPTVTRPFTWPRWPGPQSRRYRRPPSAR